MSGDVSATGAPTPANAAGAEFGTGAAAGAGSGAGASSAGRGRGAVVVVSTQAAADESLDTTGPVICDWMRQRGFSVESAVIVADGGPIADIVAAELAGGARIVVLTGGTGVTPTDRTPEAVAPFIDLEIPGIIEELRRRGAQASTRALLTRGVAGLAAGGTFVVTLPGSRGGVRDGFDVIDGVLDHLLDQVAGEGHAPRGAGGAS
ncbi:molybdenum cofactor biosynthesis protein B [Curtobacterium sp. MCBD17_028]|uniref:MogA/MoaB family molybdenum cofactor biosynthesis protein n=1 Tax=Curtobacterium sp. MCBD17_028 TaxID=2175670 RepID=UPI0021ABC129|nr:MogA/MoaB family molybdenum cofactor biosynthesis protein [Curtobacterium sp. MCBD17_028]